MKIRDVMTHNVKTCAKTDSLHHAAKLMWTYEIGSIPVIDEDGRPLAMVTDRDIAMVSYLHGRRLQDLQASDCMSRNLWACAPSDTVEHAEEIMREHRVHRLPVVDNGKLVGLVSINDIARAVAPGHRASDTRDVVQTIGHITRPRAVPTAHL